MLDEYAMFNVTFFTSSYHIYVHIIIVITQIKWANKKITYEMVKDCFAYEDFAWSYTHT